MLNQSKLNIGRHICLSICLDLIEIANFAKDKNSNEDYTHKTKVRAFLFWLQNSQWIAKRYS